MGEELKPCPFCGKEAEAWYDEPDDMYKVLIEHNPACALVDFEIECMEIWTLSSKWNERYEEEVFTVYEVCEGNVAHVDGLYSFGSKLVRLKKGDSLYNQGKDTK